MIIAITDAHAPEDNTVASLTTLGTELRRFHVYTPIEENVMALTAFSTLLQQPSLAVVYGTANGLQVQARCPLQ